MEQNLAQMKATFIPYAAPATRSRRENELLHSKARSHAATRSYRFRYQQRPQRIEIEAVTRPPNESQVAASQQPCNRLLNQEVPDQRQVKFMSTGPELYDEAFPRSSRHDEPSIGPDPVFSHLTPVEVTALYYFLDQSTRLSVAPDFLGKSQVKIFSSQALLVSLNGQLLNRAKYNSPLMNSLLASTLMFMSQEHPSWKYLKLAGLEKMQSAMQAIRRIIASGGALRSYEIQASILYLALAGISLRDYDAITSHLTILSSLVDSLDPNDPQSGHLLHQIQLCKLHFSPPTDTTALTSSGHFMMTNTLVPARQHGNAESILAIGRPSIREVEDTDTLHSSFNNTNHDRQRIRGRSLFASIMAGSVSSYILGTALQYTKTLCYPPQGRAENMIAMRTMMQPPMRCVINSQSCLHQYIQKELRSFGHRLATPLYERAGDGERPDSKLTASLLVSLELQIALRAGISTNVTLQFLARRLQSILQLQTSAQDTQPVSALQERLHLCMLISGLLAAQTAPNVLEWFEEQAFLCLHRLCVTTVKSIEVAMSPFMINPCVTTDAVKQLMNSLAERCPRQGLSQSRDVPGPC